MILLKEAIFNINQSLEKFRGRVEQIERYLQHIYKQKDFIIEIKKVIATSGGSLDDYIENMSKLVNSTVLYNAAIISIYGSYELYLDDVFGKYLDFIHNYYHCYEDIPEVIRNKLINKSADFITNPQRYFNNDLKIDVVIKNLYKCVNNNCNSLTDKLLLMHSGNMKSKQLQEMFKDFGIADVVSLLRKGQRLSKYINESGVGNEISPENTFLRLDRLVDERNNVSHGWVAENRISFGDLIDKELPFMVFLCEAVSEVLISKIIEEYITGGRLIGFDKILHIWESGRVVGINNKDAFLRVGDYLYCGSGNGLYRQLRIKNLQNNRKDRKYILKKNTNITIEFEEKVKKSDELFYENTN